MILKRIVINAKGCIEFKSFKSFERERFSR